MPEHLENAIVNNDYHYVEQRLNQFDPVPANCVNEAFQTGLMIACQHKSLEVVKVFLKKSTSVQSEDPSFCNVNLADATGWAALHYAAESGSLECVKLLIEHKAEVDATTDNMETPLHFAAQNNFYHIVKLLIENKADINAKTNLNETALFVATEYNHPDIVDLLAENIYQLETKALYNMPIDNLPEKDKSKDYSSEDDKTEGYKLEEFMSDDSEEEDNNFNALKVAVEQNFVEIAKCLLFHLTRRNQLHEEQLNELMIKAAKEDHTKIAHELFINGANVNYHEGSI
jgi:ankyrin repeat protein